MISMAKVYVEIGGRGQERSGGKVPADLKLQSLSSQGPLENIQEFPGCVKTLLHEVTHSHPTRTISNCFGIRVCRKIYGYNRS